MREEVLKLLSGYEVVDIDVHTELFMRMNKAQIINNVRTKYTDRKSGEFHELDYDSFSTVYENKKTKWLVNRIKDLECRAFLKFAPVAMDTTESRTGVIQKVTENRNVTKMTEMEMSLFVNASESNMIRAFSDDGLIGMWSMGGNSGNGLIEIGNGKLEDISVGGNQVKMKFRLSDWKEHSDVVAEFRRAGESTKVELSFSRVPISEEEGVRCFWKERVIGMICRIFNCVIRV
ncbi:hypothetical protein ECANGB1_226 [Enterospora canceri]|uniref:Uncharacterized protein n=1 Tax=Enterospora canceri TaxID=1081671 RepID=A0A1Y1S8A0_9MICR|nr:hypothetical protein ECANGB1_226 [Enterospora canceri]